MKGIFLIYGSVTTEQMADDFLRFCGEAGITDAFIQAEVIGWGSRVNNVPDMFEYIVKNRKNLNIHAHITTLRLWREQYYLKPELRPEIKEEWLYLNPPENLPLFNANEAPVQRYWTLDPTIPEVQDYLVEKCKRVVKDNDIQGLYLERLYYQPAWGSGKGTQEEKKQALTTILERIIKECKEINPKLIVSVATFQFNPAITARKQANYPGSVADYERLQDLPKWETIVDYLMPMVFSAGADFDTLYNMVKDNPKYIPTLGCYNHDLTETQRQVKKLGTKDVTFYAYHLLSKTSATKEDFKTAIKNGNNTG